MRNTNCVSIHTRLFVLFVTIMLAVVALFTGTTQAQTTIPEPTVSTLPSNATVMVYDFGDMTLHSYTSAPETVVVNGTYVIESANGLVVVDTHLAPDTSADFRDYVDSISKPIDRLIITHEHSDHISGLTNAFADLVPIAYAPPESIPLITEEITVTIPNTITAGTETIDGITYEFELYLDAEAEDQAVIKLPDYGVIFMGDILYHGLHAVLSREFTNWHMILNDVKNTDGYSLYLPGHGLPADADGVQEAIDYLGAAEAIYADNDTFEGFQNELIAAYPEYAGQFFFMLMEARLYPKQTNLMEVITVNLADGVTAEQFLALNAQIEAVVSQRDGFLGRETSVNEEGTWRIILHWESKEDSDNSIATFNEDEVPGANDFFALFDQETLVIKQYQTQLKSTVQTVFPEAGVAEVITVQLQDGADVDGWLAANKALEENHIFHQPGFVARELGVTEDGEWAIVLHWETAEDSAASIAKFGEAPGVGEFMSYLDAETMSITVYDVQQANPTIQTTTLPSNATVKVYPFNGMTLHSYTSAPETGVINGTYVVEGPNELVVFDTHFAPDTSADFRAYVDGLNKPIERVIITHEHTDHISGLTNAFGDLVDITYAPAESIPLITEEITVTIPNVIMEGSEVIDGITFDFDLYLDAEAEEQVLTKFPGYGVIAMGDILYHDLHAVMSREFNNWLMIMNEVQNSEYDMFLAGHGLPADRAGLQDAIDYMGVAQATYAENDTYEGFQNAMLAAYPDYAGQFFFSIMEPRLYPKDAPMAPTPITSTLPSSATVEVYNYGDMTLHSYTSAPQTGVINGTYVVEGPNELVVFDTHFAPETSAEFRAYVDDIGKPIERVIITHEHTDHISGLTNAFGDLLAITYAPSESIGLIEQELGITVPNAITESSEVIDGITFDFDLYRDAEAEEQVLTKLPGYGVIGMGDILYNGLHAVLSREFDNWLAIMYQVQAQDEYDLYLSGHGLPADAVELQAAVDYLETAQTIYDDNDLYEGLQNDLIAAYPDYAGQFFFSIMEPRLYPKDLPTAVTLNFTSQRGADALVIVLSALTVCAAGTWIARKS